MNKSIRLEKVIDSDIVEDENRRLIRLISVISKELINNIYKHSDATYLNYRLYKKNKFVIVEIESDGTSLEDLKNIKESKRGVLLLRLLIDSNSGNMSYELKGDVLQTKVVIEVSTSENSFIR